MNFTVSGRSWLNRQRKSWKRRPRSAENDTGNAKHTENDLEDTRSDGNGTENEWDEKNYVIISDDAAFEEFLAEFNKNWTSSFFELPKRGRSKDVQFRFTAPRPFAGNRRPRVFFPRDGQSPNDVDAPPDFQPQINLTELFFGTTHSMVGDNETLVDYLKEMNKVEDTLTSERTEAYRNGSLNPLDVSRSHLEFILFYGLDAPRDFQTNVTLRNTMARYLSNKMERFGLLAGTQTYEPHQYPEIFPEKIPKGINIIGVLPGRRWGTKDDEIILLAAHWDTVEGSNGMDDNGSGVSVVLEVARALTEAKCVTEFSVMFVLFDLEEVGCIGSIYFIRDYLIPHVLDAHGGAKLKGAYILDTVMNYNNTPGSQIWPEEWNRQIPGRLEELEQDNMTGNFLAALYRKGVDSTLATTLSKHYKIQNKPELKPDSPYHIKEFEMDLSADMPPVDELAKWIDLLRSDHSRFWFHNLEYPWSFPAVLLTDTGPYRGDMQQCYHNSCDSYSSAGYNNVEFLASTAKALIDSTIELSQAQCRGRSPTGWFNLDETSSCRNPENTKVAEAKGSHATCKTGGNGRESTTILACIGAKRRKTPTCKFFCKEYLELLNTCR
ncbi:hypothetical protein QYM36_014220 [Artemia franciscana]|uniref:Peptidase M28 domain-containing protein n=1 Tax=Artemia franciscana TaxID=6661 RepID=A0AA88KVF1_ARTSF|nr:hypothetical protein QYM36_014220 [Artemia franciscana]